LKTVRICRSSFVKTTCFWKNCEKKKSFYPLDTVEVPSLHPILTPLLWSVSGTNADKTILLEKKDPNEIDRTKITFFQGSGIFPWERLTKDGFDYIRLTVPSGEFNFPYRYKGMSGGAFWLLRMEIDGSGNMDTLTHGFPMLTGVDFSELERNVTNREKIIVGHGIDSIYDLLRRKLKEYNAA